MVHPATAAGKWDDNGVHPASAAGKWDDNGVHPATAAGKWEPMVTEMNHLGKECAPGELG